MFWPIKEVGDVGDLGRQVKTLKAILKRVKKHTFSAHNEWLWPTLTLGQL
jgi:hypothetical protein